MSIQEKHKQIFDGVYRIEAEVLEDGAIPCKAHKTDAGFDLFATEDIIVEYGKVTKHPLNIKLNLPKGTFAQITSKSGLGSKGLLVYAGIIDESYRGIPHVVCTLLEDESSYSSACAYAVLEYPISMTIKKGQKLAQLIMHPYSPNYYIEEVEAVSDDTERGSGGFGSSGE